MACSSSVIPRSAVELLFAEDLIYRIVQRHTGKQFKTWRAAPYRNFIYNAFNDDIAEAVDFIDMMLEWEVDEAFSKMVDEYRVSRDAFINYALHFEDLCFKQGFDADNFLNFCVRLVCLACYFDQHGISLALELALFFIVKVMTNYDLFEGGWGTLKAVAKKYIERKEDFLNVLTPEISDDELSMNVLEDDAENEAEYPLSNEDDDFDVDKEENPNEESDYETVDSSGLRSKSSTNSETIAGGCYLDEDNGFVVNDDKKPKNESDHQKTDLSGSNLDMSVSSKSKVELYKSNVDYKSVTNNSDLPPSIHEEKIQNKLDHEKMNLSGSKLDLPACSEREEKLKTGIPIDL